MSAIAAVSLRRGSITTMQRFGSAAISLRTGRARGNECDCHGFLPTNTTTSARSKSPFVCPP